MTSASAHENVIITGDFNIHVDDATKNISKDFISLLSNCGLEQHIQCPTHKKGHTLDLLITSKQGLKPKDINSHDLCISDHFALRFNFDFTKPESEHVILNYRDRKNVDISSLKKDISSLSLKENNDIEHSVSCYNQSVISICDTHIPTVTRKIKVRPNRKWYSQLLRDERTKRRRLERKKTKSGSQKDKDSYVSQCQYYNYLCNEAKTQFLSQSVVDTSSDKRKLFAVAKDILN